VSPDVVILIAALASAPVGVVWVELVRRHDDNAAKRRRCIHAWGDPQPAPIGYKVFCQKCRHQEFAHGDGTLCPYPCKVCGRGHERRK
jgi:hypothetical protein